MRTTSIIMAANSALLLHSGKNDQSQIWETQKDKATVENQTAKFAGNEQRYHKPQVRWSNPPESEDPLKTSEKSMSMTRQHDVYNTRIKSLLLHSLSEPTSPGVPWILGHLDRNASVAQSRVNPCYLIHHENMRAAKTEGQQLAIAITLHGRMIWRRMMRTLLRITYQILSLSSRILGRRVPPGCYIGSDPSLSTWNSTAVWITGYSVSVYKRITPLKSVLRKLKRRIRIHPCKSSLVVIPTSVTWMSHW
jgi:hypothetical protein